MLNLIVASDTTIGLPTFWEFQSDNAKSSLNKQFLGLQCQKFDNFYLFEFVENIGTYRYNLYKREKRERIY